MEIKLTSRVFVIRYMIVMVILNSKRSTVEMRFVKQMVSSAIRLMLLFVDTFAYDCTVLDSLCVPHHFIPC